MGGGRNWLRIQVSMVLNFGCFKFRKTFKRWNDYILLYCCIRDSMLKIFGHVVAQLVGTLCYQPEVCGFDFQFFTGNPSGCTTALESTQPLTEMNTRNIFWAVKATGA